MNWNEIIINRTPVRTKDSTSCGYVAGEYRDNLVIIEGTRVSRKYLITKSEVDNYDGSELALKMRHDEIGSDYNF